MPAFNKALQNLKRENIKPVYLLYGTEYYFMEQFKNKLVKIMADDAGDDISTYDLRETAIQDVITDVDTLPFFNDSKLVFVTDPTFLQARPDKLSITHDVNLLEQYIENPAPYSILVLIAPYEKLDARKKITKQLNKFATVINCNQVKGTGLQNWIKQISQERKIVVEEEAYLLLEAEFQSNLYMLEKEIEKLAMYVGEGGIVTKEIATNVMSTSVNQNALQLVDAVLTNNLHKAIQIYKDLEKMKEEPIGLIALLAYQFRVIYQVKLLKNKGYPTGQIQSEVKVHPYVVKLAIDRSNKFSESKLVNIINELTKTDASIKSGSMEKNIAFELLLYELIAS